MGKSSVCVDQNGVDKKLNSNATLSDPSFLIFKPWMLALSYNWKWNNTIYMNFNNQLSKMSTNSYHVMRTDRYRGRDVFVVRESDENQITQYEWVDMKKRIVLKSVGPGYQLELINGLEFVDNN
jgi:predicted N-acyltransferase